MSEQPVPPAEPALDRGDERGEPAEAEAPAETVQAPGATAANAAVAELEDRLLRALADLDNLRKRYEREVARERATERARVAAGWLPVVDDLERALHHADADAAALVEGLRAVRDQAISVLARLGFPRFDDLGERFDPARHDAMGAIEADAPAGTVVAVVRPGYGTDETILRPAGVVVASGRG